MVIDCSKALQTALKLTKADMVKPENLQQNDFYSWHGHIAKVDGRNVIVLMKDKTMYCMLFRNKLPRTASKFSELVKEAIPYTFEVGNVNLEEIDNYMSGMGDIVFAEKSDRQMTENISRMILDMSYQWNFAWNDNETIQAYEAWEQNCRLRKIAKDYIVPDGGHYKDYFYYACKHRTFVNGHKCTYRKQWSEDKINAAVEEVIRKLVNNPKFKTEIQKHIGQSIDTQELDRAHTGLQERLKQVNGAKNKLANQMDNLSVSDKHYDKKYEDMQVRLDKLYDEIEEIETLIEEVETRLYNIRKEKIFGDNVYQFLLFFDKLYDRFTDMEKKTFMKSFLADVNIYEEEQADGRILRSLKFRFPVFFNGKEIYELDWDNESTVETVACLQRVDM